MRGAYPAYYHGNPLNRVPMVLQVAEPGSGPDVAERFEPFNKKAEQVVDQFFADIDDTVDTAAGPQPLFGDADRSEIVTAVGGLALFGSDYANFEAIGVPIFNLFPDMFGPHADGTPASTEGIATIHTPRDNLSSLNALTSADQSGLTASDGWMKGLELCASLEARYMLEPEMGGAQTASTKPVAYMEPQPAVGETGKLLAFDAAGTYQYASVANRTYVDDAKLQYKWDFGDGSPAAFGQQVKHAFRTAAPFEVTLTVTNRETGAKDKATRRVTIQQGAGSDTDPAGQSSDPGGAVIACQSAATFTSVSVRPSGAGLAFSGQTRDDKPFAATVYRAAKGSKATKLRKVASFGVDGSQQWDPGKLAAGVYVAEVVARGSGARPDRRAFAFRYSGSGFAALKRFSRADSCGLISHLRLSSPVFGGKYSLVLRVATTSGARVKVTLLRNGKRAARKAVKTSASRLKKVTFAAKKLRRGAYTVKVTAKAGGRKASGKLFASRL